MSSKTKLTKAEIHDLGVEYAAMQLIENNISTKSGEGNGIDLILDNGETIVIRAMSKERRLALITRKLNDLKSDYIMIVTNIEYYTRKIYIMPTKNAKKIAIDKPRIHNNESDYIINISKYIPYRNNYNILKE